MQRLSGRLRNMDIQEMGGTRKTVQAGIQFVREVLDEANKVATAKDLWVPAVNNHGGFGRWVFVEVDDVESVKSVIRAALAAAAPQLA